MTLSDKQKQTGDIFGYKWSKRDTYESAAVKRIAKKWMNERYLSNDRKKIDLWLKGDGKVILDAGCGSGFSALLFFGDKLKKNSYIGVDISDAVFIAEKRFRQYGFSGHFIKSDIAKLNLQNESVDIIFSEGVLHHTDSTEKTLKHLTAKLKKGGRFLFYVYKKKSAIREFTDDYIRNKLSNLSNEEAWEALKPLTQLGIEIGKIKAKINVPADIPVLGIKKGVYSLQRFLYWNVWKMFYNEMYSFDESNHVNFDWYRPLNCHRHTPEEIKKWSKDAGLLIEHIDVQDAGISVVAIKK